MVSTGVSNLVLELSFLIIPNKISVFCVTSSDILLARFASIHFKNDNSSNKNFFAEFFVKTHFFFTFFLKIQNGG
jgi:hypothetical protein